MKRKIQSLLVLTAALFAVAVQAKTASEVFEAVSSSIVVIKTYDAEGKVAGLGSGVVLADGEVATNCHVIEDAATLQVVHREKEFLATSRYTDWDRDVCTIAVQGLKALAVVKGNTGRLKVGARVYAIGAPRGLELTLSEGIISSLRPVTGGQILQITAPISPGSSGGGLFDEEGRLIGLPAFYLTEGQQLNFAVPVEWIKELPRRHAEKAKALTISSVDWLIGAVALEEKKAWPELVGHCQKWTEAAPQEPMAWNNLGVAYGLSSQIAKAIDACQQALHINPEYAEAWYNLGIAYKQAGQTAKAIEAYQQALRVNPEYAKAWYNLGVNYGQAGQAAKEIEAYQQALRVNPEYAKAWYNLGHAYGQAGQIAKAIEAYQQALRVNPEDAEAWYNLGVDYWASNQPAKAIEAYQQALRINPEFAEAWNNLGNAYRQAGQTAKAIEACQQALRINPEFAGAWYNLGVVYKISSQTGQVMEVYKRLKVLDPARADKFFNNIVLP